MTCDLCCWRTCVEMYRIKGREVFLCPKCRMDHLDIPRLAASLEAAKGRKCIDPDCEAHATSWGRGIEELRKEQAAKDAEAPGWLEKITKEIEAIRKQPLQGGPKLPQFCAHLIEAGDRCGRVMPCPTHPSPELKLCTCGHPVRDHWKDCGGCWKVIPGKITDSGNCDCEQFAEATRLCTCGHGQGWHFYRGSGICGHQEGEAPCCQCEKFTEATNAKAS